MDLCVTRNFNCFENFSNSIERYLVFNPGLSDNLNIFDNREVTLKKYPVKNTGEVLYDFIWYSNGKRNEFVSHQDSSDSAIREFIGVYPAAKGCFINEVSVNDR